MSKPRNKKHRAAATAPPPRGQPLHEYRVRWEIEVSAGSPREAARLAQRIQRGPANLATVFLVIDRNAGRRTLVDLLG